VSTPNDPWASPGQYGSGQQQPGGSQQDPWAQGGYGSQQQGGYGSPQQGGYGANQQGGYPQYPQGGGYSPYPQGGGYAPGTPRGYLQGGPVDFKTAVTEAFRNIFTYNGRASKSAYWWFALADVIAVVVFVILGAVLKDIGLILDVLGYIALILTGLSLMVRRLHDSDKSGFMIFLGLIPFVGGIILLVFALLDGTPGPNRFG
jgi:uncharacterized membrane protein YhaH (DUF805 family)